MNSLIVTGSELRDMMISAAYAIEARRQEINELNIFPVPDGDTGTNMSMTMNAAVLELTRVESKSASSVSDAAATALLRGARGNSGVILSLLFRGIAKGLIGKETANGKDFAEALQNGVDAAYKAVMKPQEGTILTVARVASEEAAKAVNLSDEESYGFEKIFTIIVNAAKETLAKTPDMLPVLKKAGVVDSGGKGLTVILDAMLQSYLKGEVLNAPKKDEEAEKEKNNAVGEAEEEINFTYCTEFIINKTQTNDPLKLRAYLESIGDCVLVADDTNFIKVHVHTDNPGNAIQSALKYGYLSDIKIDNMRLEHEARSTNQGKLARVEPENDYGFVAVAAGKGIQELFSELGADRIVDGGQTMNPSTEDILANIEATPAKTVVVLPNNKNIILAAEQAVSLADRTVYVLHTKTVPQGLTALVDFNADDDVTTNMKNMSEAAERVKTGSVTFAARDSEVDGESITKDEILGLVSGKIAVTENDPVKAAAKVAFKLADKNTSYINIIYGDSVTADQAEEVRVLVAEKFSTQADINVINGGQPIYHFIISAE